MTGSSPRIVPGNRRQVGLAGWLVVRALGLFAGTNPPNLFSTLGRNRALFRGWLHFAGRLMPGGILRRRETEIVILRVASLAGCVYEFEHHRHLGKRAGVEQREIAEIAACEGDLCGATFSPRERVIVHTTDVLHAERNLDDRAWAHVRQHLDENEIIELIMLVGHYEMLATFLNTVRIQPDVRRRRFRVRSRG